MCFYGTRKTNREVEKRDWVFGGREQVREEGEGKKGEERGCGERRMEREGEGRRSEEGHNYLPFAFKLESIGNIFLRHQLCVP